MTQQLGIGKGDVQQILGSAALITAFLLWLLGSFLIAGIVASAGSMQAELKAIGERVLSAQAGELILMLSCIAAMIGVAGIYLSMPAAGAAWARAGFYIAVVGTVLWTVGYAVDIAVATAVSNWLSAPAGSKEAAHAVVTGLTAVSRGTFPITVVVNWLAFVFLALGMLRSAVYSGWLGWFGLILGVVGVILGLVQTFNGREGTFNLFTILFTLTMLWLLAIGIWVARKTW